MKITKTAENVETCRVTEQSTGKIYRAFHDAYVIDTIDTKKKLKIHGNVHVKGNIANGANVTVTCGDLIVDGNIEDNTTIRMKQDVDKLNNWWSSHHYFYVKGNVGNHVNVTTEGANVIVNGNVGKYDRLTSKEGSIGILGNVGHHSRTR